MTFSKCSRPLEANGNVAEAIAPNDLARILREEIVARTNMRKYRRVLAQKKPREKICFPGLPGNERRCSMPKCDRHAEAKRGLAKWYAKARSKGLVIASGDESRIERLMQLLDSGNKDQGFRYFEPNSCETANPGKAKYNARA